MDPQSLRASMNSYKGHVTTKINALIDISTFVRGHPTRMGVQQISNSMAKLEEIHSKLEIVATDLASVDPTQLDNTTAVLEDASNRVTDALKHALETIGIISKAPEPRPPGHPNAGPPPTGNSCKINESLRPFTLKSDHNSLDYADWKLKFKAFASASSLSNAPLMEQRQYLYNCLDSSLSRELRLRVVDDTGLYEEDGCIEILDDIFERKYPLFTRRVEFHRLTQRKNQSVLDYINTVRRHGDQSEIHNMDADDIYVMRIIQGCADEKVKEQFLRAPDPSLDDLIKIASSMEIAETSANMGMARANKTSYSRPTERSKTDSNDKQCMSCGKYNHNREDCRFRQAECRTCMKIGHIAAICKSKDPTKDGSKKSKDSKKKARKTKTETSDTDGDEEDDTAHAKTVVVRKIKSAPTPKADILVSGGHDSTAFYFGITPDTGTTAPLISLDLVRRYGIRFDKSRKPPVVNASNEPMKVAGVAEITFKMNKEKVTRDVIVSPDMDNEILLDWQSLQGLRIIPMNFPEQIKRTSGWKNRDYWIRKYPAVFNGESFDPMNGPKMVIELKDGPVKPTVTKIPRKIPVHLEDKAHSEIKEYVKLGIIEPVEHPTDWVSPAFFVPKPDGKNIRLVTDFSKLNDYVKRPIHPFPSVDDIKRKIPNGSTLFCKLDAVKGYWQVELDEASRDLTTFLTPFGRFRYRRAPMGLNSSSDEFCLRTDHVIENVPGSLKIVDDILIPATEENIDQRIEKVLSACDQHGIKLSPEKFLISESVPFAGLIISNKGIYPDPCKLLAIKDFPTPQNITDVRSFLGMVNQLSTFVPNLTNTTGGMRYLLKKDVKFDWSPECEKAFTATKSAIVNSSINNHFDKAKETFLLTDASKLHGIGYALYQKDNTGKKHLIQCGSRSLADAEKRYAPIEIEAIAIAWAVQKNYLYLYGRKFCIVTDHKPLIKILTSRDSLNRRLLRAIEKIADYDFEVTWVPGKEHLIADALSRSPIPASDPPELVRKCTGDDPRIEEIRRHAEDDDEYTELIRSLDTDFEKLPDSHPMRLFKGIRSFVSLEDNLLFYNDKIIIPGNYRKKLQDKLHIAHVGFQRTKTMAQDLYYWPGMSSDIRNLIDKCGTCQKLAPSKPLDSPKSTTAKYAMDMMSIDLFENGGNQYFVLVDRYSGFPFVKPLKRTATSDVIKGIHEIFLVFGYPNRIRSDNGPQFRSEFTDYCTSHGIVHETSSPYHPESNGHAEAAVKNVKYLLRKYDGKFEDFKVALLEWRNMPRSNSPSPATLMFGFRRKGQLPGSSDPKERPIFQIGDNVVIQHPLSKLWVSNGTIINVRPSGRSFEILANGKRIVRNQRYLKADDNSEVVDNEEVSQQPSENEGPRRSPRLNKH